MKKAIAASVLFFTLLLAGCVGMVVSERPAYEYYPVYRPPEAYQVYQFTIRPERRSYREHYRPYDQRHYRERRWHRR